MKTVSIGLLAGALALSCGGDTADTGTGDSGNPDGANTGDSANNDSGNNDSGSNPDSGTNPDTSTTFQVGNVSGLVLWLDATKGVTTVGGDAGTGQVAKWADQTTHGNDARGSAMTPTRDPILTASAINSLPAVHFTAGTGMNAQGNTLTILDNPDLSLQWGTPAPASDAGPAAGDFFLEVVGRFDNAVGGGYGDGAGIFYSKVAFGGGGTATGVELLGNNPPATFMGMATLGLYGMAQSTANNFATATTAYNTGAAHRFAFQRVGNALTLFVDGSSVGTATSTGVDVSTAGTNVTIGSLAFGGGGAILRLDGDIAEMIAVKGTLAASDQMGIEGYLMSKWGI